MSYAALKGYMYLYRIGKITRYELECAIHVWQRAQEG